MSPTRVFQHYLIQAEGLLDKLEGYCQQQGLASTTLLQARLQEDMFPLGQQLRTCAGFALRSLYPLYGLTPPPLAAGEDLPGLRALLQQVRQTLAALPPLPPEPWPHCQEQAGTAQVALAGQEFVWLYGLPNFFFHLNMAYAILRQQGVPVSKGDYDGWHQYPVGFRF